MEIVHGNVKRPDPAFDMMLLADVPSGQIAIGSA